MMQSVERVSQTDVVIEQLKDFFRSSAIKAGDKLPTEKELCDTLRVGRSTLREAIRVLQVMGYVKIIAGRGAFLERKTLDTGTVQMAKWISEHKLEIRDIIDVRMALETLAVRLAIARGSPEDMRKIDQCRLDYEKALAEKNYDDLARFDSNFHQSIVEATHSEFLVTVCSVVMVAFSEYRSLSFQIKEHAANAIIPHREIASAIKSKDVEVAQLQMKRHLEKVLFDMDTATAEKKSSFEGKE